MTPGIVLLLAMLVEGKNQDSFFEQLLRDLLKMMKNRITELGVHGHTVQRR